jgi:hypothetical protein
MHLELLLALHQRLLFNSNGFKLTVLEYCCCVNCLFSVWSLSNSLCISEGSDGFPLAAFEPGGPTMILKYMKMKCCEYFPGLDASLHILLMEAILGAMVGYQKIHQYKKVMKSRTCTLYDQEALVDFLVFLLVMSMEAPQSLPTNP